jgi:hypothetical protein
MNLPAGLLAILLSSNCVAGKINISPEHPGGVKELAARVMEKGSDRIFSPRLSRALGLIGPVRTKAIGFSADQTPAHIARAFYVVYVDSGSHTAAALILDAGSLRDGAFSGTTMLLDPAGSLRKAVISQGRPGRMELTELSTDSAKARAALTADMRFFLEEEAVRMRLE